jgi:hypothetical protein
MTESEWLTHKNPGYLLRTLEQGTVRKFQLFTCACFRTHNWDRLSELTRDATDLAEANVGESEIVRVTFLVDENKGLAQDPYYLELGFYTGPMTLERAKQQAERVCGQAPGPKPYRLAVLRDIFGNPFCPVSFSPLWRTDAAVALAKGMYESRDFSAMPILADALQDAGCDSDDILNHCRDEKATHVRGCWVVDLLLGKE